MISKQNLSYIASAFLYKNIQIIHDQEGIELNLVHFWHFTWRCIYLCIFNLNTGTYLCLHIQGYRKQDKTNFWVDPGYSTPVIKIATRMKHKNEGTIILTQAPRVSRDIVE